MDATRFEVLLASLTTSPSRRATLGALGGIGLAGLLGRAEAKKKKKKKPKAVCAGKNSCVKPARCEASGPECHCYLRVDAGHIGEPFCGTAAGGVPACESCLAGSVCVLFLGGICPRGEGDFGCALACPNPR
jgi:hypothetical protein